MQVELKVNYGSSDHRQIWGGKGAVFSPPRLIAHHSHHKQVEKKLKEANGQIEDNINFIILSTTAVTILFVAFFIALVANLLL